MNKAKYLFLGVMWAIAILCGIAIFSCGGDPDSQPTNSMEPNTDSESEASFRMTIEDVFTIANRGVVVTGTIEIGSIGPGAVQVGDSLIIKGQRGDFSVTVIGIESFRIGTGDHKEILSAFSSEV